MQIVMQIKSITVPADSGTVVVGVDLGVPGAHGEFHFTADQARQFGYDLLGAVHAIEPRSGYNARGGRHISLDAETIRYDSRGNEIGG